MPRLVRHKDLDSRDARLGLKKQKPPHYRSIEPGLSLGYRKGKTGGLWIARRYLKGKAYATKSLGIADDHTDSDGTTVLSYAQAIAAAREWWLDSRRPESASAKTLTVGDALDHYLLYLESKGSRGLKGTRGKITARIRPALGKKLISSLTTKELNQFQASLAATPRLGKGGKPVIRNDNADEATILRQRRATANRVMTTLKAALNLAFQDGLAERDDAWRRVRPFANTSIARIRYLTLEQIGQLDQFLPDNFRSLYRVALFTGGRYRELCELRVVDVDLRAGTILFRVTKNGKPRHVPLVQQAFDLLPAILANKEPGDFVFPKSEGRPWKTSEQIRIMKRACNAAGILPAVSFHDLRHTFGRMLAEAGAPMRVIADALGHSDTRITEKHYAHVSPSYVASTLREKFPQLALSVGQLHNQDLVLQKSANSSIDSMQLERATIEPPAT